MGISRPPLKPMPRPEIMKKKRKRKDEIIRRPKAKLVFQQYLLTILTMAAYPNRNKPKGSKGKIVLCNNFKTFIHGKTYHYIAIIQAFDQLWAFVNATSREGKK